MKKLLYLALPLMTFSCVSPDVVSLPTFTLMTTQRIDVPNAAKVNTPMKVVVELEGEECNPTVQPTALPLKDGCYVLEQGRINAFAVGAMANKPTCKGKGTRELCVTTQKAGRYQLVFATAEGEKRFDVEVTE